MRRRHGGTAGHFLGETFHNSQVLVIDCLSDKHIFDSRVTISFPNTLKIGVLRRINLPIIIRKTCAIFTFWKGVCGFGDMKILI